jgi:hypothetical protein
LKPEVRIAGAAAAVADRAGNQDDSGSVKATPKQRINYALIAGDPAKQTPIVVL